MAARGPPREHPQDRRATRRADRRADQADRERAADSRGRAPATDGTVPTGLLHITYAHFILIHNFFSYYMYREVSSLIRRRLIS